MSNLLLALWSAFIGADRIDLAGGALPFVLTPFLVLTPVVVLSELWQHRREGRPVVLSRNAMIYATLVAALVTIVFASTLVARDTQISASRAMLLTANAIGTFFLAVVCVGRPGVARALARGAAASLVMFAVFDVVEALWWIGRASETLRLGPVLIGFGDLQNVGPVPRLAGVVGDANRAGFVLLVYGVLIAIGEPRRRVRAIAIPALVLLLIATLSRSAALGAVATLAVATITGRVLLTPKALFASGLAIAAVIGFSLARPDVFTRIATVVTSPVVDRLSAGEGSAQSHLALIERGLNEATESIPRAMIGLGYGNSHLVLQDVFPGNKYGNFHSLYVSMFAEAGVGALVLVLALLLTPLLAGGPWRSLIAGAAMFNVFYQTPAEPAFWFALASAWLTMPAFLRGRSHVRAAAAQEA